MNDITQTLLRSVLKVAGGYAEAKGLTDESTSQTIIGALVALAGIFWGVLHRTPDKPEPVPINKIPLAIAVVSILALGSGCAFNRQYATTTSTNPTNGVVSVTLAKSTTVAVGDAKQVIEKTRASAGKTSAVGASGLEQETTTGNIATNIQAVTGLIQALRPTP